jgi:hypothetical protein
MRGMANTKPELTASIKPQLARFRDGARILGVSESQIRKWTKPGPDHSTPLLTSVSLPGIRAKRLIVEQLEQLAAEWTKESA